MAWPRWMMLLICLVPLVAPVSAGCRPSGSSQPLHDRDPVFVIPAIAEIAEAPRPKVAPEQVHRLVQLLDSDDAAIRLAAFQALRDLSGGEQFGYQFWHGPEQRAEAVQRWRQWAETRMVGSGAARP